MNQLRNFRIVFSSVMISWFIAIFVRFLMPRTLGSQILGDYGVAEAWAAMLGTIAGWGFATWISVRFATDDPQHKHDATVIVHAQLFIGIVTLMIFLSCSIFVNYSAAMIWFLGILSISSIATQVAESASRMTEAAGHFERVARIANPVRLICGGASALTLAGAFLGGLRPIQSAIGIAVFTALGEILRASLTLRAANVSLRCAPNLGRTWLIAKDAFVLFVLGATPVIFSRVPQIILSKVSSVNSILPNSAAELGILTASLSLTIPLGVLVLGIQRVLIPSFSRAKDVGIKDFEKRFSEGAIVVMVVVGVAAAGLIACDNLVVEVLFGQGFLAARGVLRVTLLSVVVQYASLLLVSSAVVWRQERTAAFAAFFAFPINLFVLFLFLKSGTFSTGAEAVAWATLLYEILIVLSLYWRLQKLFVISRQAILAFAFAFTLATVASMISRFSMSFSLENQLLTVATIGLVTILGTFLVFGKSLQRIAKTWQG